MDLKDSIPVRVMQFDNKDNDTFEKCLIGEIVEFLDGEIEIAFDLESPARRTYVKFKVRDLLAELEKTQ